MTKFAKNLIKLLKFESGQYCGHCLETLLMPNNTFLQDGDIKS